MYVFFVFCSRIGGDRINRLLDAVYDVDIFGLATRHYLGESVWDEVSAAKANNKYAAVWYNSTEFYPAQKLLSVSNVDEAKSLPGVTYLHVQAEPGDTLSSMKNSFSRLALSVATGESADEAIEQAKSSVDSLSFCVTSA